MERPHMSYGKLAALAIAVIGAAAIIAMISVPGTETKTAENAPPPVINTDTTYFPSQYINKGTELGDSTPTF